MLSVLFHQRRIPIKLPQNVSLTETQLNAFKPFQAWLSKLQNNFNPSSNYQLKQIEIQSVDIFKSQQIGFIKLNAEVIHPNGKPLSGVVVLRGGTVGMLVILQCAEDVAEKYVLLVEQPRVAVSEIRLGELPAGMIDDGTFCGAAAKELEEECGLTIEESDLRDLTGAKEHSEGILLSPGLLDESIKLYSYTKEMSRNEIQQLNGKLTGNQNENENITLRLVKIQEAGNATRDAKLLLALYLYQKEPFVG
jgi:ADP-sugar diphosphatase